MDYRFDYLLEKVRMAPFAEEPFRHIEITDFLSAEHFAAIVEDLQIALPPAPDNCALLHQLAADGYRIIPFPGCVTSEREYLDWIAGKGSRRIHDATEGFGIVYRLVDCRSAFIEAFNAFLVSPRFQAVLMERFGLSGGLQIDAGIQKYLHGYEISPHPDIRRKALTWMLNINPGPDSEEMEFHTHYMRLKPQWSFIEAFWKGNPEVERDWLPWSWCETVKRQRRNNSIVIFGPSDNTIHAVKAEYDHLQAQRTQMYGNLWYPARRLPKVDYHQFAITDEAGRRFQQVLARDGIKDRIRGNRLGRYVLSLRDQLTSRHIDTVRKLNV